MFNDEKLIEFIKIRPTANKRIDNYVIFLKTEWRFGEIPIA